MSLVEKVFNNFNSIVLLVIIVFIFHLYYKQSCIKVEKMANTTDEIKNAVKQIYNSDIEAIRNLSEVATKLQAGGLTIPGNLNVKGTFNYLPRGCVIMWSGSVGQIPNGWAMCDGGNGTPDLRGRFVLGHGQGGGLTNRIINQRAGEENVTLSVAQMPSHYHYIHAGGAHQHLSYLDRNNSCNCGGGRCSCGDVLRQDAGTSWGGVHGHDMANTGGSQSHNNMPPFWVLAYIMKL